MFYLSRKLNYLIWIFSVSLIIQSLATTAFPATLKWSPGSIDKIAGYRVYARYVDENYQIGVDFVAEVSAQTLFYEIEEELAGEPLFWMVTAFKEGGYESLPTGELWMGYKVDSETSQAPSSSSKGGCFLGLIVKTNQ